MSRETITHLNTNTLIGFTDKRGKAWHYRAEEQGEESNHYPGAIPVADVERRLFHTDAVSGPVETTILTEDGVLKVIDNDRQVIVQPDTGVVHGVFKSGYKIHQFRHWLIENIATILDDDLAIGSAGLLKKGAVAWVSVEVPENIVTPEGVEFRPNLLGTTSHDGSLATTYKRVVTNTVCDNTHAVALNEVGQVFRLKHSAKSLNKVVQARDALAIVHTIADDFAAEVKALCETSVSDKQWREFLKAYSPIDPGGSSRSQTMASGKQQVLNRLYKSDPRVEPWAGTAWGVVQAVNTATHHEFTVKGASRAERNSLRAVGTDIDSLDSSTVGLLGKVLASV